MSGIVANVISWMLVGYNFVSTDPPTHPLHRCDNSVLLGPGKILIFYDSENVSDLCRTSSTIQQKTVALK